MLKKIVVICGFSYLYIQAGDVSNKEQLKAKLLQFVEEEQSVRTSADFAKSASKTAYDEAIRKLSIKHVVFLKKVLSDYQWVTIPEFGAAADTNAWWLVLHADQDRVFQKEVLSQLALLYPKHKTRAKQYAYLYDHIAVSEGRLQRYGTHGAIVMGEWQPHPLEDSERVDKWRQELGMLPLSIDSASAMHNEVYN